MDEKRNTTRPLLLALLAALLTTSAGATVFVKMGDGELADQAQAIIRGHVLAVEAAPEGRLAIDYLVQIESSLKGRLPLGAVVLRIPGGVRSDGVGLKILGMPTYSADDELLLFLTPRRDGTFSPTQLLLGAFTVEQQGGRQVAIRDLAEAHEIRPQGKAEVADGVRDLPAFSQWLQDRASGRERAADYFLPSASPSGKASPRHKYEIFSSSSLAPPQGCGSNGGHQMRWPTFDNGGEVRWLTHRSGQPGLDGGGLAQVDAAIESWNRDPNTPIRYLHSGSTEVSTGFLDNDDVNVLLFDDPNGNLPGTFDGSGLLALGGPWFECGLIERNGEEFHPIIEADVVTQDGLELFFALSRDPTRAAEELFAHELGHTLGFAHTLENDALMFSRIHDDGRGAALGVDDLAGLLFLYGDRSADDLSRPAAPSALLATLTPESEILLEWQDNADNESGYRVERLDRADFVLLRTTGPDETSFTDLTAPGGEAAYRVVAQNAAGLSAPSNTAIVAVPGGGPVQPPRAPTNLRAAALDDDRVHLTWQDNASNEDDYRIDVRTTGDFFEIPFSLPPDTVQVNISGLQAAATYNFRIRARNGEGSSLPSNITRVTTFAENAPCVVDERRLCLLGGRFEVEVSFRNQHTGGQDGLGTAAPSTDQTGLFWFFSPDNVELIVKILDGRSLNGHFWVFYGALSDVEYEIRVRDTLTGEERSYLNPPGRLGSLADTFAFPEHDPPAAGDPPPLKASAGNLVADAIVDSFRLAPPLVDGVCEPSSESLCLLNGRFKVGVTWRAPDRGEGAGQAVVGSDGTGYFWFFNLENTELVVKILDGGAFNGRIWVFYGALSDVEYEIHVEDTLTGQQRIYRNPQGRIGAQADTDAFPTE